MKLFLKHAFKRACVLRSLKVAAVVGTILGAVNHYDAILSGTFNTMTLVQIAITYLVPFSVATFGSAMEARHIELKSEHK
jgi:6,7-dimethyl-8-ribityllumazine synthase